jgi:hypothetical protein
LAGNFFGDGHPDIAVVDGSSVIDLFRNQGSGTFELDKSINMGGGPYALMSAAAGDINAGDSDDGPQSESRDKNGGCVDGVSNRSARADCKS